MADELGIKYARVVLTFSPKSVFNIEHSRVQKIINHMKAQCFEYHDHSQKGQQVTLRFKPVYAMTDVEVQNSDLKSLRKIATGKDK